MPLLKRKVLQKTAESLKDNDEVFVCEMTGELFSNYDDFFNRTMLLSSTVWSCAMTGRSNLTYRDALESEKLAKRTLKTFPTALKGPILLIASRTKRTAIHDLASDVHGYAKDVFFKGETVYTKSGDPETIRKAKIVRVVISGAPTDHIPSRLIYHVESYGEETAANYAVLGEAIIRERNSLSREKCKLFLKQHVELGPNQMLCVKKASLEEFVTSKGCTDDNVFYGQQPDFEVSKKLQVQRQKSTNMKDKEIKKKQPNIAKYLKQPADGSVGNKETIVDKKKYERAEHKFLAKEQMLLEKALLLPQVALALKEYSATKEDLELTDQRAIPPAREVRTLIGEENFPDFLFILEFLQTFGDALSIESKFPDGVTMEVLESALLLREIDGPLSDILQLLLSALFAALKSAASEEEDSLEPGTKTVLNWCYKHFSTVLTELPMDSTTVSELLRLHFIAYNQPTNFGDACFILIRDHPHIMQALTTNSVFQLPVKHVMHIISVLIYQLLQTDEVLSRVENVGDARMKLKNNQLEQRRTADRKTALKQVAQDSMKKTLASYVGQMTDDELEEKRKNLEQQLNNELDQIETEAGLKMKELQNDLEALKQNFNLHQVYIGSDRGFRNYWQFQSLPGLFVEHDTKSTGCCLERVTNNIPGLAQCEPKMRKKYITDSILKCAGNSNGLIEKDGNTYEELLLRGSSLLEQSKKRKQEKSLLQNKKVGCSYEEDGATTSKEETAEPNIVPVTHPTNHELFMCTGDEGNCPVHHADSKNIAKWGFYATQQELDGLIKSLNERGRREQKLRKALLLYRDSIESRLEMCPIANLCVQENDRQTTVSNQTNPESLLPQDGLLETMFRESLLELEAKITVGCLGKLKVNSIEKWRNAILQHSYDSQIDGQLQWGTNKSNRKYVKKSNQESSSEESEQEEVDVFELCKKDPGYDLPVTARADGSTDNADSSKKFQDTIRSMASALLQVEQSIDIKFFRHPFGPKGICKDPDTIMNWQYHGHKKLNRWEAALMRATSFSQLFVHYHVLYDGIRWSRSIERAVCMVCRLKGDASVTLLCDECNRACHMYCLKPKLKKIPEGDWFCMHCRPEDHEPKHSGTGRKRIQLNAYVQSDASEDDSQSVDDNNGSGNESSEDESERGEKPSSDSEMESDKDATWHMGPPAKTKRAIVIHKNGGIKKVNSSRSAPGKAHNQETVKNQSSQRKPPFKRQPEPKQEEHGKKRKPSEDVNLPNAGRQSLNGKTTTSRSDSRSTRNHRTEAIPDRTLQGQPHSKRARQSESKNEGHTKHRKLAEDIIIQSTGRRSLRLSTKEASPGS